jgi:hypothetical protein
VTATNATFNKTLRPGASATVAIIGTSPAGFANASPTLFTLDGVPCATG